LLKATISFITGVRLSAWNNSALTGRNFMTIHIGIFVECVEKMQVCFKSDKNNRYYT